MGAASSIDMEVAILGKEQGKGGEVRRAASGRRLCGSGASRRRRRPATTAAASPADGLVELGGGGCVALESPKRSDARIPRPVRCTCILDFISRAVLQSLKR
jgi:hypothetical protein